MDRRQKKELVAVRALQFMQDVRDDRIGVFRQTTSYQKLEEALSLWNPSVAEFTQLESKLEAQLNGEGRG